MRTVILVACVVLGVAVGQAKMVDKRAVGFKNDHENQSEKLRQDFQDQVFKRNNLSNKDLLRLLRVRS